MIWIYSYPAASQPTKFSSLLSRPPPTCSPAPDRHLQPTTSRESRGEGEGVRRKEALRGGRRKQLFGERIGVPACTVEKEDGFAPLVAFYPVITVFYRVITEFLTFCLARGNNGPYRALLGPNYRYRELTGVTGGTYRVS